MRIAFPPGSVFVNHLIWGSLVKSAVKPENDHCDDAHDKSDDGDHDKSDDSDDDGDDDEDGDEDDDEDDWDGLSPEVLVFEVLGQIHLSFWLVDRYLVFRWNLPYISYNIIYFDGTYTISYHSSSCHVNCFFRVQNSIYKKVKDWHSPSQRRYLFFSAPFDSSAVSWGSQS